MRRSRGRLIVARALLLAGAWWFVSLRANPVVRLEAVLGLSPSPLEKLLGVKGPFSGMTEGMVRLAHGHLLGALDANLFTPLVAAATVLWLAGLWRPRLRTRGAELAFFGVMTGMAVVVNWVN